MYKNKIFVISILIITNLFSLDIQTMDSDYERINPASNPSMLFSFHSSIKDAKNAVVNISAEKRVVQNLPYFYDDPYFRYYFDTPFNQIPRSKIEKSLGSGVIITSDGYIVTNNHVVKGADKIFVQIQNYDKQIQAKLIGADEKSDIAVIKISKTNLPYVKFGDSDKLKIGDIVFALGNPFGIGESVTQGIVSALNKSVGINKYENFIQTDASINMGNSGGALIDSRGALIGINTAILSKTGGSVGIGFAIPSNTIKSVAYDLVQYGEIQRGYLGVSIRDVSPDTYGALVVEVTKNSPAKAIGLQKNDLIIKINNNKILNSKTLISTIGILKPQSDIQITWIRDKKQITKSVKLASWDKIRLQ